MSIRTEAEENLRIIRSLMEKATVYRAISAPGALIGGLGAVAVAAYGLLSAPARAAMSFQFHGLWLGLLVVVTVANLLLLARDAGRRGEAFVSPGMKLALRAMLPGLLGGAAVLVVMPVNAPELLAALWVLFYGISLLAASHFAPKSICWLGRAFFVAGFLLLAALPMLTAEGSTLGSRSLAHSIMGGTFGLFHLVYAALTWPRREAAQ